MRVIRDPTFVTALYRDFCQRRVMGARNGAALSRLHIEVSEGRHSLDSIRLDVCLDRTSLIALGLHWLRGATVLSASPLNRFLLDLNDRDATSDRHHQALTSLLFTFCKRHRVIDSKGRSTVHREMRKEA